MVVQESHHNPDVQCLSPNTSASEPDIAFISVDTMSVFYVYKALHRSPKEKQQE